MRPDFWIFVLTFANTSYLATAFPEDWKPKLLKNEPESLPVFTGKGYNGKFRALVDLQEVKLIGNERAIITARNNIFVLDLTKYDGGGSEIEYSQAVEWKPDNSTTCEYKTSEASRCNNFIRVNARMSESRFLMCGTNARVPKCREYEWDGQEFSDYAEGHDCFGSRKCLLDDVPSLAYLYSGGSLYIATRVGYRRDPTLQRTPLDDRLLGTGPSARSSAGATVNKDAAMPNLATDINKQSMLNNPVFVSAMETEEKVFVFFRETAVEQFGNGETTFSRVTQVCKNDRGGTDNFRSHKWTSYFKARLLCSVPGGRAFHFDELRHVTRPFAVNGVTMVFAVMTTPTNSIWGSAVCAYTVPAIEKAMSGNFMKRPSYDGSSTCWSKHAQKALDSDPHPTQCASGDEDTRDMETEKLRFRLHHPLMHDAVPPTTGQPLFMRSQARYLFTAIDVETDVGTDADGRNVTILYIGTSDGRLLKVVPKPFDALSTDEQRGAGVFVEEIMVYNAAKCAVGGPTGRSLFPENEEPEAPEDDESKKPPEWVLGVTAVEGRNAVLVAFRTCVVSVPKQLCSRMQCRKDCVQSGNPYCGWMDGSCVAVTEENRARIEQDLFSQNGYFPTCLSESDNSSTTFDPFVQTTLCPLASSLAAPAAILLATSLVLILIAFLAFVKCRKGSRAGIKDPSYRQSSLERERGHSKRDSSWDSSDRKPIYNGPRNSTSESTGSVSGSRPPSFTGQPSLGTRQSSRAGHRAGESSDSGVLDDTQPYGYASMDSLNGSLSRSSSGSVRASGSMARNAAQRAVHIVGGVEGCGRSPHRGGGERDPNLNNNNLKKNVGIAHGLSRAESPFRRRPVHDKSELQAPATNGTRMGLTWGTSAGGTLQRQPPSWKANNLQGQNVVTVAPMPVLSNPPLPEAQTEKNECPGNAQKRRSDGTLPKPPATGLTAGVLAKSPRIVSGYNEVENLENRTFRRGASLKEPYYSETPPEPEYENTKHQRKMSVPADFNGKPPPLNAKPGRKFSSFTASHFNTKWFPSPALQENLQNFAADEDRGKAGNCGGFAGCGTVHSSSTASDGGNPTAEGLYMEPYTLGHHSSLKRAPAKPQSENSAKNRPSNKSADEGYGSELVSSEDKRNHSNGSSESDSIHVYSHISNEDVSFFSGIARSPDEENIIKDLDGAEWSNGQEAKTKTLKKKKSAKKKKNNCDKRPRVLDLSSPSDSENVFAEGALTVGSNNANKTYRIYHEDQITYDSLPSGQTLDDSFVDCGPRPTENEGESFYSGNDQYAFNTMRPPGRMRQKLPRLRCGPKDSEATLRAVPTPEIPKF